jgi:hypothetical protein
MGAAGIPVVTPRYVRPSWPPDEWPARDRLGRPLIPIIFIGAHHALADAVSRRPSSGTDRTTRRCRPWPENCESDTACDSMAPNLKVGAASGSVVSGPS